MHTASQGYPGWLKQVCRTAPLIPVPVSDCLRLHFYIVTSIYIVFSARALLPNSIFPLLLPQPESIGLLMRHKLIVSHFRLPCHSFFCLFSLWTGRVSLLEGVKECLGSQWISIKSCLYKTMVVTQHFVDHPLIYPAGSTKRRMSFHPYSPPRSWWGHWGTWASWCPPCHLKSHFQLCGWKLGLPAQTSASPVTHCRVE